MFQTSVAIEYQPVRPLSEAQQGFMDEFLAATKPSGKFAEKREYMGSVEVTMQCHTGFHPKQPPKADEIILDYLLVHRQRDRQGTKTMNLLTSLADKYGLAIGLEADPMIGKNLEEPMSRYNLMEWYKRFDFEAARRGRAIMWREPKAL